MDVRTFFKMIACFSLIYTNYKYTSHHFRLLIVAQNEPKYQTWHHVASPGVLCFFNRFPSWNLKGPLRWEDLVSFLEMFSNLNGFTINRSCLWELLVRIFPEHTCYKQEVRRE